MAPTSTTENHPPNSGERRSRGSQRQRLAEYSAEGASIEHLRQRIHELQDEVGDADRRLRAFVRERPLAAVMIALAGGFMLGRVLRRF